jgi:cytoskeletal protein CcmA (bactofilin family)
MNKFREQLLHDPNTNFGNQSFSEEKLVITKSTNVSGVLDSENDIVLDGNFNGVLYSKKTVHITPSGVMTGVIICNDIKVEGEFEGSVFGLRVNLCKDSVLKGNIHCTIINTEMNQYVDANIKLISLETSAFESSSMDLYSHLKEVFGKNNKDNNYLNIFQEKMSQVKPSNKFYHQTIYVAPNPPSGTSDDNNVIEPDQQ